MCSMSLTQRDLQRLVRRDVVLAGAGSVVALAVAVLLVAAHVRLLPVLTSARLVAGVAVVVVAACVFSWASGPRSLLRDRVIVLIPMFLIAGPGLIAVHQLGGGTVTIMLSSAVGVVAAVALGMMWSARRRSG